MDKLKFLDLYKSVLVGIKALEVFSGEQFLFENTELELIDFYSIEVYRFTY